MKRQSANNGCPAIMAELSILSLAARAIDTRRSLHPSQIERVPSLGRAFDALESVLDELGWGGETEARGKTRDA